MARDLKARLLILCPRLPAMLRLLVGLLEVPRFVPARLPERMCIWFKARSRRVNSRILKGNLS